MCQVAQEQLGDFGLGFITPDTRPFKNGIPYASWKHQSTTIGHNTLDELVVPLLATVQNLVGLAQLLAFVDEFSR
jgi:hypothetical protein